jgi:hypothetical protein
MKPEPTPPNSTNGATEKDTIRDLPNARPINNLETERFGSLAADTERHQLSIDTQTDPGLGPSSFETRTELGLGPAPGKQPNADARGATPPQEPPDAVNDAETEEDTPVRDFDPWHFGRHEVPPERVEQYLETMNRLRAEEAGKPSLAERIAAERKLRKGGVKQADHQLPEKAETETSAEDLESEAKTRDMTTQMSLARQQESNRRLLIVAASAAILIVTGILVWVIRTSQVPPREQDFPALPTAASDVSTPPSTATFEAHAAPPALVADPSATVAPLTPPNAAPPTIASPAQSARSSRKGKQAHAQPSPEPPPHPPSVATSEPDDDGDVIPRLKNRPHEKDH